MTDQTRRLFEQSVVLNYQLYNGLFTNLPLDGVQQAGPLLPLLGDACRRGLADGESPDAIIGQFLDLHKPDHDEARRIDFLFRVIQYVERQVVLVDALEDAAYRKIHRIEGKSTLQQLIDRASDDRGNELARLLTTFGVRVVLTAHPTQFYPGPVLAIISDLTKAISAGNSSDVRDLLQQLGNTPFFQKRKPSPYDEAVLLTWYLGNVFYQAVGDIVDTLSESHEEQVSRNSELISIGFWPGGDRDGNPFVTIDTTRRVANKLRTTLLACYHRDVRALKRRLSFDGVYQDLETLEKLLAQHMNAEDADIGLELHQLLAMLDDIELKLRNRYQSLYLDQVLSFRRKVKLFGLHFASIDIRQDSRVLARALAAIQASDPALLPDLENAPADAPANDRHDEAAQVEAMLTCTGAFDPENHEDPVIRDTLQSFAVIREIQQRNGSRGAHRYIISNCRGAIDVARVIALFRLCGWGDSPLTVDIVPLFETIDDLEHAADTMRSLFANAHYRAHLRQRGHHQTVMLGFSDGTKDGGYLMANWAIYSAKENVTRVAREYGVEVLFFDGRGGPPARGGGDTYLFYAALGKRIESNQIQMTVQGQTISSHYGHRLAAEHNLGELMSAGLDNNLYDRPDRELDELQRNLLQELARTSHRAYQAFKQHPLFLPYLEEMSTLKFYAMANVGSRPVKRGADEGLKFEDLRAIPFVGAWSQLKQNVPGFYGLGSALKAQEDHGRLDACVALYRQSRFFRALVANSMQSMSKTNFALTRYMRNDPRFGEFWQLIHDEFELSREMTLKIAGQTELLEDNPRSRLSIRLREDVVLPLLVIQQYALIRIQQCRESGDETMLVRYEKMVMRSLFGNINASRNSA